MKNFWDKNQQWILKGIVLTVKAIVLFAITGIIWIILTSAAMDKVQVKAKSHRDKNTYRLDLCEKDSKNDKLWKKEMTEDVKLWKKEMSKEIKLLNINIAKLNVNIDWLREELNDE